MASWFDEWFKDYMSKGAEKYTIVDLLSVNRKYIPLIQYLFYFSLILNNFTTGSKLNEILA